MNRLLVVGVVSLAILVLAGCAAAEPPKAAPSVGGQAAAPQKTDFPTKSITCIVPYEAGAGTDVVARWIIDKASAKLGQPIVVVNKPGAAASIGGAEIHDSKPDGYTIGVPTTLVPNLLQGLAPYDHRGFDMIGVWQVATPIIGVSSKRPWKTLKEAMDYAKAHPGELKMATPSKGAVFWISGVLLVESAGVKIDILPQPGASGMVVTQLAGGQVDLGVMDIPSSRGQVEAGNIRYLAQMDEVRPAGPFKDVPSLKELGYAYNYYAGAGIRCIVGPKGIPQPVLDRLTTAIGDVCKSEEYKQFMEKDGNVATWLPGEEGMKIHDSQKGAVAPALEAAGLLKTKP